LFYFIKINIFNKLKYILKFIQLYYINLIFLKCQRILKEQQKTIKTE
jgi:hypothetical protein